jgi:wyosine [tRNA(Phe)-imidazoG37] synthetase (radical SAM superfamily)
MLFMVQNHAAVSPFHSDCLKFVRKLREAPERTLQHSMLLKRMKVDAQTFHHLVQTLSQQGDIETISIKTPGRTGLSYRLVER